MKKRVLSLFLALTLCLTLLPTAAFAAEPNATESGTSTTIEEKENEIVVPGSPTEDNGEVGDAPIVSTGAPAEQNTTGSAVAKVGDMEYDTLQEILDDMSETEITLLGDIDEDELTVYATTTIIMDGHCIKGDIDITDGTLTLENGTVNGTVKVTGGTLNMTAPETAEVAITKGLNIISGSAYVSDAQVGVKGTLSFGGDSMVIIGTEKAVELDAAVNKQLYGSTNVDGDTTEEATFMDDTYQVNGKTAKKLSNKQAGGSTPVEPASLTLTPETANVAAGEAATFTVTYTGTDELNAYVQKNAQDENVTVSTPTKNSDGTYTIAVKIAEETPTGDYTLYVHETSNVSVQASATIHVISTVAKDDKGTYYPTIEDAIEKAPDGSTITVIAAKKQISLPDGIYVDNETGITLDLNGHSLDGYSLNVGGNNRTGSLKVIDRGGNGAVGVTVRNGGTLVFKPENDSTTLLQLEVWGGTVELYGGKILRNGLNLQNGITLGSLLPTGKGLAYYYGDKQLTLEEAATATCDLVVKTCSHGGASGFDSTVDKCPNCGAAAVAQAALEDENGDSLWRRFADLQTAIDANRQGGTELTLLTDVTGDYTIDGSTDTGLDLNGHSIHGTIYVGGTKGDMITTTLSNTKNTATASIDKVVASSGAELAGSGYPAVIGELTLAEGATWENILQQKTLGYKVQGDDGSYKWYAPADVPDGATELTNVIINRLPITSKALSIVKKADDSKVTSTVERNTELQLRASCNAKDATVTFYVKVPGRDTPITFEGTYQKISNSWYYVASPTFGEIGEYDIYFYAEKDGYSVTSAHKKLTVTKLDLSKAEITFPSGTESAYDPYTDATSAPPYTVTYNGKTLTKGVDYTVTDDAYSGGVGTRRLTIKATTNGDYTGQKTAEWEIVPHKVKISVGDAIKIYDGTTDLPADTISLVSADSAAIPAGRTLPLSAGSGGYELTDAKYDSADASTEEKTISFTIKLTNRNYTFEDDSMQKAFTLKGAELEDQTFKINQATVTPNEITQYVFNDLEKTYEIDLKTLLPELTLPCEYGSILNQGCNFLFTDSTYLGDNNVISVSNEGILTLPIVSAHRTDVNGQIGTITVPIVSTNYRQFDLIIKVVIGEKIPLDKSGVTVSATDITYGQTLAESTLTATGSMSCPRMHTEIPGTFAWTDPDAKPNAGSYEAEWTFTPAEGYEEYATVTGKVTVNVAHKSIEGAEVTLEADSFVYDGNEKAPVVKSVVLDNVTLTSLKDYGYIVVKQSNVGTYHFAITGDGNYTGEVEVTWKITAREVTPTIVVEDGAYNGGDAVEPNFIVKDGETVIPDTEYSSTYINNTKAGTDIGTVTITNKTGGNYIIKETSQNFTINKAAAPTNIQPGSLNVINGTKLEYTYDAKQLLPDAPKGTYGKVSYNCIFPFNLENGYYVDDIAIDDSVLTLTIAALSGRKNSKIGTIPIYITTDNYESFDLPLDLYAVDKITPVVDGDITASNITYGDELSKSTISGKMKDPTTGDEVKGTFAWTNGTIKPNAGSYDAEWMFTPAEGYEEYAPATGKVKVTVNNAKQSATLVMSGYTYGETPVTPRLEDRKGKLDAEVIYYYFSGDGGTMPIWDTDNPPKLNAGTYTMRAMIAGTQNYDSFTTADVQFTVAKATPDFTNSVAYTKPTGLTATYGQTLADVTLTNPAGNLDGTWSWMDSTVSVGNVSTTAKTFKAKFTPKDTANYNTVENIELDVTVNKANQATLTIQGKDSVVYGETLTLTTTGGSTGGKVTYSVDKSQSSGGDATIDENGVLTPAKVGTISVIATMAGNENYNDVTSRYFVISITKGTPTGAPNYTKITTGGKTLKDAALTTKDSTLKPKAGTLEWVDDKGNVLSGNTVVEANTTYKWRFTPTDTNYTTLTGEVELYHRSSGGGGSSGYSYYTIKATAGAGGSISPSGNVSVREGRDQTFTITPDKGYAVSNVKIDGKSIGAVKSYTFENVSRTHTIEVIFMKANGNPQTGVFVDVATGSYYEDAVDWAVENGITQGTDDTHFAPDGICTRAQAVTFLWRAAGSPAPKTNTMPFTDVNAGSYYYDAVLWAVENGITEGTSDTTFSPNMICSRAQIVTFLWRAEKSPAAGSSNPFTDVAADAYYADAVLWAVKENITAGTTTTTFSPDDDCTRAQIVTFLYRMYQAS